ncbi:hypothetical protein HXX76_014514 [Chlamydomonas incerta]|uniref:Uncharacterized protein n=1 Tax=Chlamydomonas incerta TaxID=51695 RepID=A0A835SBX6_CHLIN|nr:hypothetical protein HXX76_014514 [Chlamydomonas incerta]|eukprot:KAG2424462.1 hypothetical protein HXX76_014514 [Chlamydomonas incerta]
MSWSKIQLYRLHVTLGGPILTTGESVMLYVVLVGGLALVGLGAYKQLLRLAELAADRLGGGGAAAAGQGK